MPTVKSINETLEKLKDKYDNLRAEIADDFKDDWIDKALPKIEQLLNLRKTIEQMENLEVKVN